MCLLILDFYYCWEWWFSGVCGQCDRFSEKERDSVQTALIQVSGCFCICDDTCLKTCFYGSCIFLPKLNFFKWKNKDKKFCINLFFKRFINFSFTFIKQCSHITIILHFMNYNRYKSVSKLCFYYVIETLF